MDIESLPSETIISSRLLLSRQRVPFIIIGFVIALLLLALIAVISYHNINVLRDRVRAAEYSYRVLIATEELMSQSSNTRIAWRGFLTSGEQLYLADFEKAVGEISKTYESLKGLTKHDLDFQKKLTLFFSIVNQDIIKMRESMRLKATGVVASPSDILMQLNVMKPDVAMLQKLVNEIKLNEKVASSVHSKASEQSTQRIIQLIIMGNIVGFTVLVLAFVLLKNQISNRNKIENALKESEEHFRSLAESAVEAIISANSKAIILFWNPGAQRMFGYTEKEIIGKPLNFLAPEYQRQSHQQDLRRFLSTGESTLIDKTTELLALKKDGTEFPIEISLAQSIKHGEIFLTAVIRDITRRKVAEAEIIRLNEALTERINMLESFSYSVSHDLRAPLRAINGFSEIIMARNRLDDECNHYLDNIIRASRQMGEMIDDLLRFGKLGHTAINLQPIKLQEIGEEVTRNFSLRLLETSGRIVSPKEWPVVMGEHTLLIQIFTNLLDNALKFCKLNEPPLINISCEYQDKKIQISVADNGIGVANEYLEKIFVPFQRLHAEDQYPGTGIGLAIVAQSAKLMGGEISAKSTVNSGTVFILKLRSAIEIVSNEKI